MLLRRSGCDSGCAFHDRSNQRTRCHTGNNPGRLQCQLTGKHSVHTSDSPETAIEEINRFFKPEELFEYKQVHMPYLYHTDEYQLV